MSSCFIFIISIRLYFQYFNFVSAARRYQGTMVIKFIHIISYRRLANTNGIQRHGVVHLHFIGGLRCSIGGSDLLGPVSSSSIGGSIPPIGGLSVHPLSHRFADTVVPANTTPPRCALELTQLICSNLPICVRSTMPIANPLRRLLSLCPCLRNNLLLSPALTTRQSTLRTFALSHLSGSGLT